MTYRASTIKPDFDAMPTELQRLNRWVLWKGQKVPYDAAAVNSKASSTNPDTWAPFELTRTAYDEGGWRGVGFMLNGDGIAGIDLDGCVTDGKPGDDAMELLDSVGCSYVELSPSGKGLHGYGYAPQLQRGLRGQVGDLNVELYTNRRYLTVTGRTLKAGPLQELPGFAAIAEQVQTYRGEQKRAEDDLSHPLSSSVGIPAHTIPHDIGERNSCLFELARWAKGKHPHASRDQLRAIVREWHTQALPYIGTKDFTTSLADFLRGFEKVRHPYGQVLSDILQTVDYAEALPVNIEKLGYGAQAQNLLHICLALARHHGKDPFFLSARQAGDIIDVHFTDASKMLYAFVADGVLELVKRGSGRKASRYRWKWRN